MCERVIRSMYVLSVSCACPTIHAFDVVFKVNTYRGIRAVVANILHPGRTYFGISRCCRETAEREENKSVIKAAGPAQCDCVETVNPIRFGALGSSTPSLSDWNNRVL